MSEAYRAPSRVVLTQTHYNLPPPARTTREDVPRLRWPSQKAEAPSRCGHCGAALIATDVPTSEHPLTDVACVMCSRVACELISDSAPRPMSPEEFRALPIEQPRRVPPATPHELVAYKLCPDCRNESIRKRSQRCRPCMERLRNGQSLVARLVAVMGDGRPVHLAEIEKHIGVSYDALGKLIRRARANGRPIVRVARGTYRLLEVAP